MLPFFSCRARPSSIGYQCIGFRCLCQRVNGNGLDQQLQITAAALVAPRCPTVEA